MGAQNKDVEAILESKGIFEYVPVGDGKTKRRLRYSELKRYVEI